MHPLDYIVLIVYFLGMAAIGFWSMRRVKVQEDYFMGGRSFGKLLQTFAAFGAGTGSSDPVNTGRTTFTSGMSGMWSVMYWLFVTPFYWIAGVWYRRMRHLTLGDWFVERYESKSLGAAYAVFGICFYMIYGSMLFSAIGKVAAPLMEATHVPIGGQDYPIEYILVPIIGAVVLVYGIAGGIRAAYYTDLVQGLCIILLSVILIPFGLHALVEHFGDPSTQGMMSGFRIIHEQLPAEHFQLVGTGSSEFPLHRIVAVVIINLVGIVVQPHFIITGGGSAKTETSARIGLVTGNFLKRFCTIGWVLTALIALALFADHPELVGDPDKTWGVASRELLGPGLTGLMLACLLAALMSSIDAYMITSSALVVRNIYAAYFRPHASERECVLVGRITGVFIIVGAVWVSLRYMNVFAQLQLTWVFPILFAAPFWIGMYWRRATTLAAWQTVIFCTLIFFVLPQLAPIISPGLRTHPNYSTTNRILQTTKLRSAAPADVAVREARSKEWQSRQEILQEALQEAVQRRGMPASGQEEIEEVAALQDQLLSLGSPPQALRVGDPVEDVVVTGGQSIFWQDGVRPIDDLGRPLSGVVPTPVGSPTEVDAVTTQVELAYPEDVRLKGLGAFKLDFLVYRWAGMNLTDKSSATLGTLELPIKIVAPFLVMFLLSLITPANRPESLDRYYAKMKTPVNPDPEQDRIALERAYAEPEAIKRRKLFPGTNLEFQRPTIVDLAGFVVCFFICFGIIGLAVWVANIGVAP